MFKPLLTTGGYEGLEKAPEKTVVLQDKALLKLKGFVQIPKFILMHPKISFGAKITYGVLLSYAWQEDFCYPAQASIAKDLNLKERQVRNLLTELKKAGLINWKQQGLNKPNIYFILSVTNSENKEDRQNIAIPDRQENASLDRQNMSHPERQNIADKLDSLEEESYKALTLRNVDKSLNGDPNAFNATKKHSSKTEPNKGDEVDFLVMDIMEICGDAKSKGFYRLVASKCPREMVYAALSEVKDLKLTHQLKKTPGAAFTAIIQEKAKREGLDLGLKKK